jgi:succinoglycan biosynthesis protein ExoM
MLTACLESLMLQATPNDLDVRVVVVDNEPRPNNRGIVNTLRNRSPLPIQYLHEHRRGIACARNRVIDAALGHNCDWIAFIDDDEVADPYWIAELMAPEYRQVPVLDGRREFVYPDPLPFWAAHRPKQPRPEGARAKTATTANVRFSMTLVRAGLRFDESLGLMGGEDIEFFSTAHKLGFEIRQTQRAITHEQFHRGRLTYRAQVYRAYWNAASDLRRAAIERGTGRAMLAKAHTVPLNILIGALEIAVSPLFIAAGPFEFKRRALAGGKKIAKGIGRAASMIGHLPQPYAKVHGE